MRIVRTDPLGTVLRRIAQGVREKRIPGFSSKKRLMGGMTIAWLKGDHRAVIHQDRADPNLFHWYMSTLRLRGTASVMETDKAGEFSVPDGLDALEGFISGLKAFLEV